MLARFSLVLVACCLLAGPGCALWRGPGGFDASLTQHLPNPLPVSAVDPEFLWLQLVDTVDDYFKIDREIRMRADGGVMTDGLIQTFPVTGASYLEPWRPDSTHGFERLHATYQSIRRRATVRVTPVAGGYHVEIAVYKELEDVAQPEHARVGAAVVRHDGSLVRNEGNAVSGPATLGWIPQGRDATLEQRMLTELRGRLQDPSAIQRLPGPTP